MWTRFFLTDEKAISAETGGERVRRTGREREREREREKNLHETARAIIARLIINATVERNGTLSVAVANRKLRSAEANARARTRRDSLLASSR